MAHTGKAQIKISIMPYLEQINEFLIQDVDSKYQFDDEVNMLKQIFE